MAGVLTKHGVPALGWWLIAVGTFRSGALDLLGYLLRDTDARHTWANGRGVDSAVVHAVPFNLDSKPVYAATFLSFFYALSHLVAECMVYHTISAARLSLFIFIAGTSMLLHKWNSNGHGPRPRPRGATKQP